MANIILGILALFGAFCLFVASGIIALFLKAMHALDKEKRQRRKPVQAEKEAEQIIQQLLK